MSTIAFFPEGAFGPTNNCVGIANVLKARGHRPIFVVEESFAGTLEAKGFEEAHMRLTPPPEVPEEPGQFWKEFIRDTAPHFRETPFEQITTLTGPIWEGLVAGSKYVNDRLKEIFADIRPDAIVEDNVVLFPAVLTSGVPWARCVSCNPLEMPDPALPPALSGLPTADPTGWDAFRCEYHERLAPLHTEFDAFIQAEGLSPLPPDQFMVESPYLNMYLYPGAVDYERSVPLAPTWHRIDSSVRRTEPPYELPENLRGEGPLLYVSLGSLGSAEPTIMRRLIDLLGRTNCRVIVSMGPQSGQIPLPDNMSGAEYLPQPSILPLVDLVITHAGNNTTTECFNFGKPMVALPLFWDQHDNAQRLDETGFGIRLASYGFTDEQLYGAIERLLADTALRNRMAAIAQELQSHPGVERAADLIEQLARTKEPVLGAA